MDILSKIAAHKREEVAEARRSVSLGTLDQIAEERKDYRSFEGALTQSEGVRIIAEIKRASPSKGIISEMLDPAHQAGLYELGGAAAISVLTETRYFMGSLDDLRAARAAVSLPVLRKDFMLDPYQIAESAAAGADAILLIVRMLSDAQLNELFAAARQYGLDALVEVHDEDELERSCKINARLIGINNRNLKTFDTSLDVAVRVASSLSDGQVAIAASGVSTRSDVERNLKVGISRFLIGESLVRADYPVTLLRELRAEDL